MYQTPWVPLYIFRFPRVSFKKSSAFGALPSHSSWPCPALGCRFLFIGCLASVGCDSKEDENKEPPPPPVPSVEALCDKLAKPEKDCVNLMTKHIKNKLGDELWGEFARCLDQHNPIEDRHADSCLTDKMLMTISTATVGGKDIKSE